MNDNVRNRLNIAQINFKHAIDQQTYAFLNNAHDLQNFLVETSIDIAKRCGVNSDMNRKLWIVGIGRSYDAANIGASQLATTCINAFAVSPGQFFHGDLARVHPNDTFLGISKSGTTDETLRIMQIFEDKGCMTIGITDDPKSPLATRSKRSLIFENVDEMLLGMRTPTTSIGLIQNIFGLLTVGTNAVDYNDYQKDNHPGGITSNPSEIKFPTSALNQRQLIDLAFN